jgi:hypothetical protein
MPFSIRPYRRFPLLRPVTYNTNSFQGQGTLWKLFCTGLLLSGDLPMRPWEKSLSLAVPLPNEQPIIGPEAVVRWSHGQELPVKNLALEAHTQVRLQNYVKDWSGNRRRLSRE